MGSSSEHQEPRSSEILKERIVKGEILLAALAFTDTVTDSYILLGELLLTTREWLQTNSSTVVELFADEQVQSEFSAFVRQMDNYSEEWSTSTKIYWLREIIRNSIGALRKLSDIALNKDGSTPTTNEVILPDNRDIFIIHGHDHTNMMRLERLLKNRFDLNPLILIDKAGQGRTLIEKFEEIAQTCHFAFALLTPDDLVKVAVGREYAQARPNAIFELGWFCGRLGRRRICILTKEGTHLHSDLAGISRIEFKENVEEKITAIESELRAATLVE